MVIMYYVSSPVNPLKGSHNKCHNLYLFIQTRCPIETKRQAHTSSKTLWKYLMSTPARTTSRSSSERQSHVLYQDKHQIDINGDLWFFNSCWCLLPFI